MKLVVLSYSHHGRSMARTAHELGHDIVGVMDGDAGPRQQLAEAFQCRGFESVGRVSRYVSARCGACCGETR